MQLLAGAGEDAALMAAANMASKTKAEPGKSTYDCHKQFCRMQASLIHHG